jgi:hypothetical protein
MQHGRSFSVQVANSRFSILQPVQSRTLSIPKKEFFPEKKVLAFVFATPAQKSGQTFILESGPDSGSLMD